LSETWNLESLRETRARTRALIEPLSQAQLDLRPFPGKWSAGEVVDHLLLSEKVYRKVIADLIALKRKGEPPVLHYSFREIDASIAGIPKSLLPALEIPFQLMTSAIPSGIRDFMIRHPWIPSTNPAAAEPRPGRAAAELKEELLSSFEQTNELFDANRDLDFHEMRLTHPIIGNNDAPRMIRFLALHEARHHGQLESILASPGFPKNEPLIISAKEKVMTASVSTELAAGLAKDAESALKDGGELFRWWVERVASGQIEKFSLDPGYPPYLEWNGFFDKVTLGGKQTTVVGCMQQNLFKPRSRPGEANIDKFESFFDREFLVRCRWTHPDGLEGGFRYKALLSKTIGQPGFDILEESENGPDLDLSQLGKTLEWIVLRVDILDFIRVDPKLEPFNKSLSKHIKESAYIVLHAEYQKPPTPRAADTAAERTFGYAFLPREAEPNFFGFGPGHFGAAIKQWRFSLKKNGDLDTSISFIVSPRSEKVLNLGGFDPVYTSIGIASAMTLGTLGIARRAQDALDRIFMLHHARVHSGLVVGMAPIWERPDWFR